MRQHLTNLTCTQQLAIRKAPVRHDGDFHPGRQHLPQPAQHVAQPLVAEHLHCAVVGSKCVVERQLVVGQPERRAAGVRLEHLAGETSMVQSPWFVW